jgi:hypothetical protein
VTKNALSRHGVPIRLTDERWAHIVEEHAELAGLREEVLQTVAQADAEYQGHAGERVASRALESGHIMLVVYREASLTDGFVITAFLTSRPERLSRRPRIWP